MVPQAGAWPAPQKARSRWGRKTLSVAAPEAAVVCSVLTEENPECSSGIVHQPKEDTHTQAHTQ